MSRDARAASNARPSRPLLCTFGSAVACFDFVRAVFCSVPWSALSKKPGPCPYLSVYFDVQLVWQSHISKRDNMAPWGMFVPSCLPLEAAQSGHLSPLVPGKRPVSFSQADSHDSSCQWLLCFLPHPADQHAAQFPFYALSRFEDALICAHVETLARPRQTLDVTAIFAQNQFL